MSWLKGCMECNLNDYWKLQDEELGDACTVRNVFISQGAQFRNNITSTRNDHDYDKWFPLSILSLSARLLLYICFYLYSFVDLLIVFNAIPERFNDASFLVKASFKALFSKF